MQHPAPLGLCALTAALAVSSPSVCFLRFGGNCYLSTFAPLPVLQSRSYRGLESTGSTARRPSSRYLGSLRKRVQLSPTPGDYLFLAPPGQTLGCFPPRISRGLPWIIKPPLSGLLAPPRSTGNLRLIRPSCSFGSVWGSYGSTDRCHPAAPSPAAWPQGLEKSVPKRAAWRDCCRKEAGKTRHKAWLLFKAVQDSRTATGSGA